MVFADLKNDFVFRRIFARRPDILRGLLTDLLDRRGDGATLDRWITRAATVSSAEEVIAMT